jgi:hypothetical protein
VTIGFDGDAIVVTGLSATVRILGAEEGLDQFLFGGFGGDDRIVASGLSGTELFVQGEAGDEVLGIVFGDTLSGDDGDDVILADGGGDSASAGPATTCSMAARGSTPRTVAGATTCC